MKVIFLDFDGVLNSHRSMVEEHEWRKAGNVRRCEGGSSHWLPAYHIEPLNRIVRETGAQIVISSTWRLLYSIGELRRVLKKWGFEGRVVGKTVDGSKPIEGFTVTLYGGVPRGSEIAEWVNEHKPESFVILDDDGDMQALLHRLVQTDSMVGLTEADADKAIALLTQSEPLTPAHDSSRVSSVSQEKVQS